MPTGVYKHHPNQGFQKGHRGFVSEDSYANRPKPEFSEEFMAYLRERGKTLGKYTRTPAHRAAQGKVAGAVIAKLNGWKTTWIEERFEMFLEGFGLIVGRHFVTKPYVKTHRTRRYPDFLLANKVIIEVDGKAWHTPEKDQLRDIELGECGFKVFHFTGSEIRNDPIGCCDRLVRVINDHTLEETYA